MRRDLGEPPLVTPSSQIVGTQAVLNVATGKRYKMVSQQTKALLNGEYGRTARPSNESLQKRCWEINRPSPADLRICWNRNGTA